MNIYFIILMALSVLNLGMDLVRHGTEETKEYNFWITLIAVIIQVFLIYNAVKIGF